ncbi:hypothetical protein SAMN05216266_103325 [Amycolatopsis marina]|uniref:Copper-transporting ATPase n=1 Tax=Amycolatopsis marina TaxID=490629 RepID=A0A1I0XM32_9PSEU|nr:DUF6541 family protein [Amycolatopsis marina]SFB02051.1 hypothetical protein SAMN05216266_103325 [Amycolatopsis marina]
MPTEISLVSFGVVTVVYAALIVIPGLLVAALAGLRGWQLAAVAPLLTYAVAGLAGPWLAVLGIQFTVVSFLAVLVLVAAAAFGVRARVRRRSGDTTAPSPWAPVAHWGVLACLLVAAAVGAYTILRGLGAGNAVAQGFDAVYHANGIRYIAETGDGSLTGTGNTNWYAADHQLFYPNAYHLVGSLAYTLTGVDIPVLLNAGAVLLPALLALSVIAVVRRFNGRAVLAGAAALVVVAPVTLLYESLDHGPLYPFLLGLALTPLATVVLQSYLTRPAADTGFLLAAAAVGLLTIHSSTLFTGILFAAPLLLQRWSEAGRQRLAAIRRDLVLLLPIAAAGILLCWLQLFGALGLATGAVPYKGWPSDTGVNTALGSLLTFQHFEPHPQLWLTAALVVGLVTLKSLGELRWIAVTALITGIFAVAVMSSDHPLVKMLSRPWWDDPYRFLAIATVPLCLLAAHGIASTQRWLYERTARLRLPVRHAASALTAAVVLAVFILGSGGLYSSANASVVQPGYGPRPGVDEHQLPLSKGEAAAMLELAERADPGDWAMNDRADGTVWTYALSGVRTVAGHFDRGLVPPEAQLLSERFNRYRTDPEVRATVEELNVRWVIVGTGGYPQDAPKPPGLTGLDELPFLDLVYRNRDAALYELRAEDRVNTGTTSG